MYLTADPVQFCRTVILLPTNTSAWADLYAFLYKQQTAQTCEYLQEVLLLMLASKPVLVSANRSVSGKFSENTENKDNQEFL